MPPDSKAQEVKTLIAVDCDGTVQRQFTTVGERKLKLYTRDPVRSDHQSVVSPPRRRSASSQSPAAVPGSPDVHRPRNIS